MISLPFKIGCDIRINEESLKEVFQLIKIGLKNG